MSRDARVQVVDGLELQSAVEEVKPFGTIDIHGRPEHFLGKGLVDAEIRGAHCEVAERDLHVQGRGDHVADHDEGEAAACSGDGFADDAVAEPRPEEDLAGDFEPSMPPRGALSGAKPQQQVFPA